jgi:hypothetical protein
VQIDASSREEYFAAAGEREPELRELDAFIRRHAPDLPPVISTGMGAVLGYGEQPYQTTSMKEPMDWPVLALAVQKRHISLYICALEDGEYVAEKHAAELGKVSCGKSCVRFTKANNLNLEALAPILAEINRRFVAGERLYAV